MKFLLSFELHIHTLIVSENMLILLIDTFFYSVLTLIDQWDWVIQLIYNVTCRLFNVVPKLNGGNIL